MVGRTVGNREEVPGDVRFGCSIVTVMIWERINIAED
jgi:hypothetical protein